jgi:hypothetical protein
MELNATLTTTDAKSLGAIGVETERLVKDLNAAFEKFNERAFRNDDLSVPQIMSIAFSALSIVTAREVASHSFALAKTGKTDADDTQLLRFCDHLHEATWRNAQAKFDEMMKQAD